MGSLDRTGVVVSSPLESLGNLGLRQRAGTRRVLSDEERLGVVFGTVPPLDSSCADSLY